MINIITEQKCDSIIENATCPNCHTVIRAPLIRVVQAGTVIGIPFIKSNMFCYTKCSCCEIEYRIPKRIYNSILQDPTSEVFFHECNKLLQASKKKELQYAQKSDRKWGISFLLALIGGLFGLQHWYMGFKKRGIIAICMWVISVLSFVIAIATNTPQFAVILSTVCLAINAYWGLFDAIRIFVGKAKDRDNKYIMTNGQHQKHLKNLQVFR